MTMPLLKSIDDVVAYYEPFRQTQIENFARFVISKGYGATTPNGHRQGNGEKKPETWQACGRRLFGERFVPVMERMLLEHNAAMLAAGQSPPAGAEIADPEF